METIFAQVLGVHIEEENASVLIDLAGELLNVLPSDWELGTVESEVGKFLVSKFIFTSILRDCDIFYVFSMFDQEC